MIDNDARIISAVQNGQTEAFAKLVDRYKERVYGILMRLAADPHVAEELAQETFVRAYQSLGSFRGESRFSTWLVQIAVNLARDHVRKRRRTRIESLDAFLERHPDDPVFENHRTQSDPLTQLYESELMEKFEVALRELPPSYREVFVLRHIENISYEEIAKMTSDSIGSLKVRTHRARRLLKEKLFPDARETMPEEIMD